MNTEKFSINERFSCLMVLYFFAEEFKKGQYNKVPQLRLNVSRETFYNKLYVTYQNLRNIRLGGLHTQDKSDFDNIITDGIKENFKNFDTMKAFFVGKARDWYNADLQKAIEKRIGI